MRVYLELQLAPGFYRVGGSQPAAHTCIQPLTARLDARAPHALAARTPPIPEKGGRLRPGHLRSSRGVARAPRDAWVPPRRYYGVLHGDGFISRGPNGSSGGGEAGARPSDTAYLHRAASGEKHYASRPGLVSPVARPVSFVRCAHQLRATLTIVGSTAPCGRPAAGGGGGAGDVASLNGVTAGKTAPHGCRTNQRHEGVISTAANQGSLHRPPLLSSRCGWRSLTGTERPRTLWINLDKGGGPGVLGRAFEGTVHFDRPVVGPSARQPAEGKACQMQTDRRAGALADGLWTRGRVASCFFLPQAGQRLP